MTFQTAVFYRQSVGPMTVRNDIPDCCVLQAVSVWGPWQLEITFQTAVFYRQWVCGAHDSKKWHARLLCFTGCECVGPMTVRNDIPDCCVLQAVSVWGPWLLEITFQTAVFYRQWVCGAHDSKKWHARLLCFTGSECVGPMTVRNDMPDCCVLQAVSVWGPWQ